MRIASILFAACGALALASCSSPKPITSTPPAKGLKVQEFSFGDGIILKKYTYPTGDYRPEMEDSGGYYYYPNGRQIRVTDTGIKYGTQGGIYWKKSLDKPQHIFFNPLVGPPNKLSKKDVPATPVR